MSFVSGAPRRAPAHQPGCRFGDGFYKVVYDDHLGQRRVRVFETQTSADLLVKILAGRGNPRCYRDACLDAPATNDAATPDVVDGEWWLGLPRAQAMEELGLTKEADYIRVQKEVEDLVYARGNRESQGGVRVPIVIRRKKTRRNAHLFVGGRVRNIRPAS